jgi:hypothetical protein
MWGIKKGKNIPILFAPIIASKATPATTNSPGPHHIEGQDHQVTRVDRCRDLNGHVGISTMLIGLNTKT